MVTRTCIGSRVRDRRERSTAGDCFRSGRDLGPRGVKTQGPQKLRRTPDEFGSMFALLRVLSTLRNPGFTRPLGLSLSELLQSHLPPCIPSSHPLLFRTSAVLSTPGIEKKLWILIFRRFGVYCLAVIDNCTDDPAKAAFQDKIKIMRPCILIGMPVDSACHFSFFLNRI